MTPSEGPDRRTNRLDELWAKAGDLEREIENELKAARHRWRYRLVAGRVRFARDARLAHARLKQGVPRFLRESSLRNLITAPVIYSLVVPVAVLDLWVTIYQRLCFPVYGIAAVTRSRYVIVDRHHLAYLNAIEKANCMFCSYANGVFAYVREVAGRTEQYWCPIRHAHRVAGPHGQYRRFVDYGDADGYRRRLMSLRAELKAPASDKG